MLGDVITEAEDYAARMRPVTKLVVTGQGPFRASITRAQLGALMVQDVEMSQLVVARLHLPALAVFGFSTAGSSESWNGVPLAAGEMVVHRPEREMQLHGHGRAWRSLSLPPDLLEQHAALWLGQSVPRHRPDWHVVAPRPAAMQRLQALVGTVSALSRSRSAVMSSAAAMAELQDTIAQALLACLATGESRVDASGGRRGRVLRRMDAVLESHDGTPLRMAELCRLLNTPERSLRAICQAGLGMPPHRYLKLRRLDLVRLALTRAGPAEASVTEVATRHGFWELGRFAAAYRARFGEAPSATLARPKREN